MEYITLSHKNESHIPIKHINLRDGIDFNYNDLSERYPLFKGEKPYIGNSIFPIIDYAKEDCIVQEYDTLFTGDYNKLIKVSDNFDVMFQKRPESVDYWVWNSQIKIPEENKVHCPLQWYKISKKALDYIYEKYKDGWYGHYECIVPTAIINNNDFKVGFLEDYYPVLTDYYTYSFSTHVIDHLRYNRNLSNCLLHPVK